ncbi:uncharacterized protein LOC114338034 isoform X2 [Diabrotica virgifera virgifera]|uniref:Sushi domain-containing protein n=1 Tax=Diabrotica virgifera virgifera TaxID=50390 RepID=A0ABM5K6G4_DIAVI|nr:uncharacterized protein LOC114338034 isoform X2 [Diabrotica virgifera virgifera]
MILFSNIKISYVLELPGCTTMAFTVLFLSFLAVAFSNCYTITQDLLPIFPTQEIIGNNLVRHLPNGENVTIICPDDTILNKDTLTCDFKSQADSRNLVNEIKPCDNNCRAKLRDLILNCFLISAFAVKSMKVPSSAVESSSAVI